MTEETKPTAQRQFSWEMHERFAAFSGDRNPMHMDRVASRRTQAGAPVVHGIHAMLWALDHLAQCFDNFRKASKLKVSFYKWIYVDTTAELYVVVANDREIRAQIRVGTTVVISLSLALEIGCVLTPESDALTWPPVRAFPNDAGQAAVDVPFERMKSQSGQINLSAPGVCEMFPHLTKAVHWKRVAALASLSTLVGMHCPGLNSIFSGLALNFNALGDGPEMLVYNVQSVTERYRLVKLAVDGPGLSGLVEAFVRLPPSVQISMEQASGLVAAGEFVGAHALVIGGSRGLGEATAKLIAAGGGDVTITYVVGKDQAMAVADEIRQWGGKCEVISYDATQPCEAQLGAEAHFSHVYYYATGQIFRVKQTLFSAAIFQDFTRVYVDGFYDLCRTLSARSDEVLSIFYPSSVAVSERQRDMTEYAMVKAAGEALCEDMSRFDKRLRILWSRLPRLSTDQTLSVIPVPCANPEDILLPIIRSLQGESTPAHSA